LNFKRYIKPSYTIEKKSNVVIVILELSAFYKSSVAGNLLIVNQHSIAQDFKDYQKAYSIGGSVSFGNIRGLFNVIFIQKMRMHTE